jgi:hypothetical protein
LLIPYIPLTAAQQDWAIAELTRIDEDDDNPPPGVVCEKQGDHLWISHDETADIDCLGERLQTVMKHFDIVGPWGFVWSSDCSAPRTDAYGGGACVITQTDITSVNTHEWLHEHGVSSV